jgi:two-component system, OmpR family, sensor histidine kinase CiaH
MFKKTRIRLVALNSIVFFLLLNVCGGILYFYMEHRLNGQADEALHAQQAHLERERYRELVLVPPGDHGDRGRDQRADMRIVTLVRDEAGEVVRSMPDQVLSTDDEAKLRPSDGDEQSRTVDLDGHPFRVMTLQIPLSSDIAKLTTMRTVQLVYNFGPEQEMLRSLLTVLIVASVGSVLIAVPAGLFLARRALVPIQNAWNRQQEFVADASHELRTPLTVMKVHMERLFRHPEHTIEDESEPIGNVIHEIERISRMVADLLTLARSDSDQLEIQHEPVRLDKLIGRITSQFEPLVMMKELEMRTEIEEAEIIGDEERLHQMLVILLDNALKFTQEGKITVSCRRLYGGVSVSVADTGMGISDEDLPHVFGRFYRGDKARGRAKDGVGVGGTGLGLAIAKWVVEAHGGKIRAESRLGEGTEMILQFPLKK